MIPNHLWQSTLFAAATALLTLVLRHNRAQIRYWLWLAASLKFLIPFSLLMALGAQFEWRTVPAVAPPLTSAIGRIAEPFALPAISATTTLAARPALPAWVLPLLAAVWFCGCAAVVIFWLVRCGRIRAALRSARHLPIPAPVRVMTSPALLEPGIFGIFRPVLLLPEGIEERLTPAQLRAILAHELCHLRRRDNLAAAIHMVVEAVFWFHPLVWWLGARLVEERERACDEEVLRLGSDPEVYAAGILNVCKHYLESPLACASGVTGADLKKRIEAIMTHGILPGLTTSRKLLLAAAGLAAVAGPVAIGIVNAPAGRAQSPTSNLRFEVASIKPVGQGTGKGMMQILPGGGLRLGGVTLKGLIAFAYGVRETQISGGDRWMDSDSYELLAKPERSEAADNPQSTVAPGTKAWSRIELRTQALLADRFQLVIHKNVRQAAGYALVTAKGGFKLPPDPEGVDTPPGTMRSRGRIDGRRGTMVMLATVLTALVGSPVVDRTGLSGSYTYKLQYAQDFAAADADSPDVSGPSVFTALQEQLGLKLESSRVDVETIVIDRAKKPSPN